MGVGKVKTLLIPFQWWLLHSPGLEDDDYPLAPNPLRTLGKKKKKKCQPGKNSFNFSTTREHTELTQTLPLQNRVRRRKIYAYTCTSQLCLDGKLESKYIYTEQDLLLTFSPAVGSKCHQGNTMIQHSNSWLQLFFCPQTQTWLFCCCF